MRGLEANSCTADFYQVIRFSMYMYSTKNLNGTFHDAPDLRYRFQEMLLHNNYLIFIFAFLINVIDIICNLASAVEQCYNASVKVQLQRTPHYSY